MEVKPEVQTTFDSTEIGHLCSSVLKTVEGKALFALLKDLFMYRSPFLMDYTMFGSVEKFLLYIQGHANLIRFVEQQAKAYTEPKK